MAKEKKKAKKAKKKQKKEKKVKAKKKGGKKKQRLFLKSMKFKGNLDPYVRLPFFIQALLNPHNTPALSPDCLFAPAGAMQTTVGQWLTGSKTS